jgi:AraC family transcriptional regulator
MTLPRLPDLTIKPRVETRRTAGKTPLDLTLFDLPPHHNPDPVSDNFVLCLALRGTVRADFQFGSGWHHVVVPPGTFMPITPPRTSTELVIDAPHRHLMISLPLHAVSAVNSSWNAFGSLHSEAFRDKFLSQICIELWQEAKTGNKAGDLFADCARATLVAALARRAQCRIVAPPKLTGFSYKDWMRLFREIDGRLDQPITVAMLAALVDMRETRFLQAFKQQTGMSPYRYVLQKRLERANDLIIESSMGLPEIALATGFADQAHMTAAFGRHFGRTPGAVRRARH